MQNPSAEGNFERWGSLARTLRPLLTDQVGGLFLPWSQANADAIAADEESFTVSLRSGAWTQKPQKYHARSLAALKAHYATLDDPALATVLTETGCLPYLAA